jgi:nucleoid DNA-binding protein
MYSTSRLSLHNKLIKEVAEELGIDTAVVAKLVKSQWEFVAKTIDNKEEDTRFYGVKIKYFGSFGVTNNRFKYTKHYKHYSVPKELILKLDNIDPKRWKQQADEQNIEYTKNI